MAKALYGNQKVNQIGPDRRIIGKIKRMVVSSKRTHSVPSGSCCASLPHEILLKIFHCMDVKSLLACASTCKRWQSAANENVLWKELYCYHFGCEQPSTPLEVEEKYWKARFFKQSKRMRNRVFLRPRNVGRSCDFAIRAKANLQKLGNKFQICLTTSTGKVYSYHEKNRVYDSFAIVLGWYSLERFPVIKEVKKIEIFSMTPVLVNKSGKMMLRGPKQRCLVLCDESLDNIGTGAICNSDEISCVGLQSGIMIGLWKKTNDIAFLVASVHTYQLLDRCLLSTSDQIFADARVVKCDDVSRFYGLQGYDFHIQVVTGDPNNVFEFRISSDVMDMKRGSASISYTVKNPLRMFAFKEMFIAWHTDLFHGRMQGLTFFTFTAIDFNKDVIFHASQPAQCEAADGSFTNFECHEKSGITLTCFDESIGNAKLFISRHFSSDRFAEVSDEGFFVDSLEVNFNTKFINQWFGTHY